MNQKKSAPKKSPPSAAPPKVYSPIDPNVDVGAMERERVKKMVKDARVNLGISQSQIARDIGISKQHLSKLNDPDKPFSMRLLKRVKDFLLAQGIEYPVTESEPKGADCTRFVAGQLATLAEVLLNPTLPITSKIDHLRFGVSDLNKHLDHYCQEIQKEHEE